MKTEEELNALKNEVEALNTKLTELTEDELKQVVGGGTDIDIRKDLYENIILSSCRPDERTEYQKKHPVEASD